MHDQLKKVMILSINRSNSKCVLNYSFISFILSKKRQKCLKLIKSVTIIIIMLYTCLYRYNKIAFHVIYLIVFVCLTMLPLFKLQLDKKKYFISSMNALKVFLFRLVTTQFKLK